MGETFVDRSGPIRGKSRVRAVALGVAAMLLAATFVATSPPPAAEAASPCGANINPIVCENQKPGTDPSIWDISGAGDTSIQGFATDISVNAGQRVDFKIDTDARSYRIDIYRTGWYQGLGARKVDSVTPSATLPQNQPACISDVTTELYDCGTWGVSGSWNVPADAVSGVYLALLHRNDTGGESHILFIVRNDGNASDVLFQTSDPTWHAYNSYGGSDFYQGAAHGRAYKVSYNRPFATREGTTRRDFYFSSEYATVRFLERNGYDVSYIAGVDTDRRGSELLNHDVFLSVGHDEYWSGAQRANITAARDAGVNLQFLSGNEGYWRTRYEASVDGASTPYRTLVSYKETWANAKIDPAAQWTGTWRDPRFAGAAQGGHSPENALTGTMYMVNHNDLAVTVNAEQGKTRLWRNTGLSSLGSGSSAALAAHTVGYESNEDIDNGFRPPGLIRLSTTIGPTPQYLTDYGNTVVPGTTEHHVTLYRAASGALVFSAASIQWGWGLDQEHDGDGAPADPRMQQAQINLLADMGAQPGSLMPGMTAATKSTDASAPTTTITSPTSGQAIAHGTVVTVTGTAADVGGGRVAGVEVSTDGGATWRLAQGTTSWSFSYVQQGSGAATVKARAIDDSANFSAAGASVAVTVGGPYSVFGGTVPATPATDDGSSAELGLRFSAEVDGFVTGVRFYKGSGNGGQHTGSLWNAQGTRLASVVFAGETATGWQTALFSDPVPVVAGQQYTVSYTAPQGRYAYEEWYWPYKARATAPLHAPAATGTNAAGVYGIPGTRPTTTYRDANYFVDVTFEAAQDSPVRLTSQSPTAGATGVARDTLVSTVFTRPVQPASVGMTLAKADGTPVAGTTTYDETARRVRFSPSAALDPVTEYRVTVSATPVDATTFDPGAPWTFTTANSTSSNECPCTLYTSSDVPTVPAASDTSRVAVGTRFTVTEAGFIAAVNFYKGPGNTGSHTATLWSASGQSLGTAAYTSESASGWQTAWFDAPIAVNPGTAYVVSYVAPVGAYSVSPSAFATGYSRGPLQVPESGGAFTYATGFPSQSSTSSYFVDPVFVRSATGPHLVSTAPLAGATDVLATSSISATFTEGLSASPTVTVTAGGPVAGTTALSADGKTVTFTPAAPLPWDTAVQVTMAGLVSASGTSPDRTWSFRTSTDPDPQGVTFFGTATPTASAAADGSSVELGMAFRSTLPGRITAIRFFKPAADTATHTGTLWSPTGQALATVVFQNESADGWQRAELASPVAIAAGDVYTVSYLSPQGRYAHASGYFSNPVTSGPLTAIAPGNGVFRYGTGGVMPQSTWAATNYFVDVEFSAGNPPPPLTVTSRSPEGDAVEFDAKVTAELSADAPTAVIELSRGGTAVAGVSAWNGATRTVTFTPQDPLDDVTTYQATVRVGGQVISQWSFTTRVPDLTGVIGNLFGNTEPSVAATTDTSAVEVGTQFSIDYPGSVTAIRFYKGVENTGTHVGHLWNANGDLLATATFTSETASGWQRAELSTPVVLTPKTVYLVSYHAPVGRYAVTSRYFQDAIANGYVTAPAGTNGRFSYGPSGTMPTSSFDSSAYFVDAEIAFAGSTAPAPAVTARTPAADATNVDPATATISATVSNATAVSLALTSGGSPVAGTSSYTAATGVAVFTPAQPLDRGRTYAVSITANGAVMSSGSWSFSTRPDASMTSTTPASGAVNVSPTAPGITASLANAGSASLALTTGGTAVPGSSSFDAATGVVSFTPSASLEWGRTYTVAATADGKAVTGGTWSFSTLPRATLTTRTPAAGAANVDPTTAQVTATLASAVTASIAVTSGGVAVPGTSSLNTTTGVVTFTPTAQLAWARTFSATVTANGTTVTGGTWTFTTQAKPDQVNLFGTTATPANANTTTLLDIQVATRFRTSLPGVVRSIRFYKGNQNTGTHTGYLWASNGTRLAQVTFSGETASGWQTATLSTPVRLTVGAEYRVGLYSTANRYPVTNNGLSAVVTSGPLTTIANGGAYTYNRNFPNTTTAHKYWVDVIFDPDD